MYHFDKFMWTTSWPLVQAWTRFLTLRYQSFKLIGPISSKGEKYNGCNSLYHTSAYSFWVNFICVIDRRYKSSVSIKFSLNFYDCNKLGNLSNVQKSIEAKHFPAFLQNFNMNLWIENKVFLWLLKWWQFGIYIV